MRFFVGKIIIPVLLAISSAFTAEGRITTITEADVARRAVTEARLRYSVEFLSDSLCAGRATGEKGSFETVSWLTRQFSNLGMMPLSDSFVHSFTAPNGKPGRNVIGMMPGSKKFYRQNYIIVAAHFDGLGEINGTMYPCADANASGVASMLGVASMFRALMRLGRSYPQNIVFVALDANRSANGGAAELWRMLKAGELIDPVSGEALTTSNTSLMVNIDQVGATTSRLRGRRPDYLIMLGGKSMFLTAANADSELCLELALDYYGSRDFTDMFYKKVGDQKFFVQNGRQAVMFTSGITMNNNKPYDNAASLDYEILKKRTWLIYQYISKVL